MDDKTKQFVLWLCDVKCPFSQCHNGYDPTRERVCFEKSAKHYTLDQVFEYFEKNIFGKG